MDCCQFCYWGYQKPTRIWGPPHLEKLRPKVCDWRACPNLTRRANGYLGHKRTLGATPRDGAPRIPLEDQYRIPKGVLSYIFGWDRKETDWKVPLQFRPPDYPPPPLKTADIQQSSSSSSVPMSNTQGVSSASEGGKIPVSYREKWGPPIGTAAECTLCAKGICGAQKENEWLPASAHNVRGRRDKATLRHTAMTETETISAAALLPIGIPKRRRKKARMFTPKSQTMESQTSGPKPFSSHSCKARAKISDHSSFYELSSMTESEFGSDSALV